MAMLFLTTITPAESSTRSLRTMGPFLLVYYAIEDRIQAASRRFKLKSCSSLKDEQSYLCKLLHLQDEPIQHRGGKHPVR